MRIHPASLSSELDDTTVSYVQNVGPPFEDLRQVAAQLAGILLLAAAGSKFATPQHPVLGLADASYERAMDSIRSAAVPQRAAHHHFHLMKSGRLIGNALASCKSNGVLATDQDLILSSLREAWDQLRMAAGALPGFEIVAFDRACCAEHVRARSDMLSLIV
jgi:hypothetical protein